MTPAKANVSAPYNPRPSLDVCGVSGWVVDSATFAQAHTRRALMLPAGKHRQSVRGETPLFAGVFLTQFALLASPKVAVGTNTKPEKLWNPRAICCRLSRLLSFSVPPLSCTVSEWQSAFWYP
jgi:hypothetical protein